MTIRSKNNVGGMAPLAAPLATPMLTRYKVRNTLITWT